MVSNKDAETTFVQCMCCGSINESYRYISFKKDYVDLFCNHCDGYTRHLNLGQNEDDKYLYMDINMDQRYYRY